MLDLPELNLQHGVQWIRIPAELDVPVTQRVKAILDSAAMRRLSRISQLGLVSLVYPGATHSRLEHSLGVYRLAVQVLNQISRSADFSDALDDESAKLFLIAALVHDIGHWPFCHPLEDMRLDWIPRHEQLAKDLICDGELGEIIRDQWQVEPEQVAEFLAPISSSKPSLLRSLLNGPIDVDKMDYLQRDSLHAGVPYGRNFDIGRLINSLCPGPNGRIAITEKGKTAAEMMVFARYVMFSEVYWHHAVRCATAMLQRVVYEFFRADIDSANSKPAQWLMQSEAEFASELLETTANSPSLHRIGAGLFGRQRRLYKRLAQFNFTENSAVHRALARRPYSNLVACAERLSERLNRYSTHRLEPTDVLVDAPPVKLEVQFQLDVRQRSASAKVGIDRFLPLGNLSPVVSSLATNQFDNFVKRVRVFVCPDCIAVLRITPDQLTDELLAIASDNP
jgi:HD superfamily phosphohydrolase